MTSYPKINYSKYISKVLEYDYTYLANIFSEVKGITIEHYIIAHKIEKVKELQLYDELNLRHNGFLFYHENVKIK